MAAEPVPNVGRVMALSVQSAKTIGLLAVVLLVAVAIAAAWMLKTAAQRIAVTLIFCLLAVLVWSQRAALQDCADRVTDSVKAGRPTDTTCSFFGQEITIDAASSDATSGT